MAKQYIENLIDNELKVESYHNAALNVFTYLLKGPSTLKYLTIHELSAHSGFNLSTEEAFILGVKLTNLSIPVFRLNAKIYDDSGIEHYIDDSEIISHILEMSPIYHPDSGEELSFEEYRNFVSFLFVFNRELIEQTYFNEFE